jgi:hypothetical protein
MKMPHPRSLTLGLAGTWLLIFSLPMFADQPHPSPLSTLDLPPVEKQPWRFTEFPIIAWWAPPGNASIEDFAAYREAGFNIHPLNRDTGFWDALEKAEKVGLKVMPYRSHQGFVLEDQAIDFDKVKDRDSVIGWITHDEPGGYDAVIAAITAVNTLMRQDPTRWAIFNLLPPAAQVNPSTRPVVDAAVAHGMPVISYDQYVIAKDHTNSQAHFDTLELFRTVSLEHDVPFWAFALTIQHWNYRRSSESDVRWTQFTNLAYGAKGLWYFTYWGPTDWENWDSVAIVDPADGSKTDLYYHVQAVNKTVQQAGHIFLDLRNEGVFHTKPPARHQAFQPKSEWISDIDARDALVSFFRDSSGTAYAMVVNKQHGINQSAADTADTIVLEFAGNVASVEAVSWLDGQTGPLSLENGRATLEVAGGTGVLLRADFTNQGL